MTSLRRLTILVTQPHRNQLLGKTFDCLCAANPIGAASIEKQSVPFIPLPLTANLRFPTCSAFAIKIQSLVKSFNIFSIPYLSRPTPSESSDNTTCRTIFAAAQHCVWPRGMGGSHGGGWGGLTRARIGPNLPICSPIAAHPISAGKTIYLWLHILIGLLYTYDEKVI